MNPIDFVFKLLANYLEFTPDDHEKIRAKALADWDASEGKLKKILSSPYVLIALPLLLPVVQAALNYVIKTWLKVEDNDNDGEIDMADAILEIIQTRKNKLQ